MKKYMIVAMMFIIPTFATAVYSMSTWYCATAPAWMNASECRYNMAGDLATAVSTTTGIMYEVKYTDGVVSYHEYTLDTKL